HGARLVDDAIEGDGGGYGLIGLSDCVVRLLFDDVAEVREAEADPGRRNPARVLAEGRERLLGHRGRQLDLPLDRAGWVADKSDFHFFAEFAAGGDDGGRTGERTDVETILGSAISAIGAFLGLVDIGATG